MQQDSPDLLYEQNQDKVLHIHVCILKCGLAEALQLVDFSAIFIERHLICDFLLALPVYTGPSEKGIYDNKKEFAPHAAKYFLTVLILSTQSKGCKNIHEFPPLPIYNTNYQYYNVCVTLKLYL